jgi:TonB family protein
MRHILVSGILLSPLFLTAAAVASTPATDSSASTPAPIVSTGVVPAKVVYSPSVTIPTNLQIPIDAEVVLQLTVGEDGKARDIQVIKSISPLMDAPVLDAVGKFRFSPATLDNAAIPMGMSLTVVVQH